MNKFFSILFMAVGMLLGGCGMALPISPLMFLLENNRPVPPHMTPGSLDPAAPTAAPQPGDQDPAQAATHA